MKNLNRHFGIWIPILSVSLLSTGIPQDDKAIAVDASGDQVAINGKQFPIGPTVEALVRLWGEPDSIFKGINNIRIWDDLGVRAYSEPGSLSVDSLTFSMKKQDKKHAPENVFSGKIETPKGTLTKDSTSADLKELGFTENTSLSKYYDLDTAAFSFFAEVDEEAGGELVELSIEVGLGL